MPRATLLQFAHVNDRAAATTKKLEKQAILAEYFRALEDDDLRRAVRFAGGRTFPGTDERVLNVGGALVSEVVLALLRLDPHAYHDLVVRSGEIGEALAKVWDARPQREIHDDGAPQPPAVPRWDPSLSRAPITLEDLSLAFDALASTGQWDAKRAILLDLFARCADGREAAYLAKVLFGDLRTGVQAGVLHDAIAKAFDRDRPTIQRCHLLVGDLGDVAVLAKHDACGTAHFRLFHPVQFMLATPVEAAADAAAALAGRTFYAEDKLDGIRAQIHKSGGTAPDGPDAARVAIYTRTMDRTDASFPDVVAAVRALPGEFLLDGEIVPWCDGCVMPFAHIQKRLGRKVLTPKILRDNPAAFVAFDILYHDGELLMDKPLRERRAALEALAGKRGLRIAECGLQTPGAERTREDSDREARGHESGSSLSAQNPASADRSSFPQSEILTSLSDVTTSEQITAVFAAARDRRNEGIILKDPDSPYSPGRRGQLWFKLKTHLPTLDCVVTAAEYGHGKRRSVLSDYTFAVWDRDPADDDAVLLNVGKAYSGVTDEEIAQLTELFLKIARGQSGRVYAVPPKIVLEIACDQIQLSKRHASGYAFRFPRIKRIRWDKRPQDADRLARVIEVYQSTTNFGRATRSPDPEPAPEPTLFDGMGLA